MANDRDYVAIAIAYANEAIADRKGKKFGKLIRLAAKRFIADLRRARRKRGAPFLFDEWHANDPCDFIEKLPHVEGVWDKPDIELHASHIFFLVQLFGFRKFDGTRRYSTALFAIARKNAKSTVAAATMIYCLCCEDEPGAQVVSGATTYDQASIIFRIAKKMVDKTPDLADHFGLETWAKAITREDVGSNFKAIHAKASTQDGLNPSHVCLDEIHAHKDGDLINVLQSAGGARRNPLYLLTTTEGYTNTGPWSEYRHFAKQILDGTLKHEADHFLAVFYQIDDDDDEFDESSWVKANPLMEVNPSLLDAIRKDAVEAKKMASKMAEFRIKRLNRESESADAWVDLRRWKRCVGEVDLEFLAKYPCYGALDLASTGDLCALRWLWIVDGVHYTWGRKWVPENAVTQRTQRGVPIYQKWIEAGWLIETEGDVTDYNVVEAALREDYARFNVRSIAYDRWNAMELINRLTEDELPMIEFVQGPKSYHPAMQELERTYLNRKLAHGGDPVLQFCASNMVARKDVNLNMAPDKRKSADKIDDICALLMCEGVALSAALEGDFDEYLRSVCGNG